MKHRRLPAGGASQVARSALNSLPSRIGAVFVAAVAPISILLALRTHGERGSFELAGALVAGLVIVIVGLDVVLASPLRRLGAGIDRWRESGEFDAEAIGRLPTEFMSFASSFKRATSELGLRENDLHGAVSKQQLAMQEIHHRVKNNLQIVASLLNLQASRIRLPEARAEFQSARDRIRALATVHRHLYAHGELNVVNMRSFLSDLCGPLFTAMGDDHQHRIKLEIDAPELQLGSDQAVPLSLIVTEAVTNALKYGFPGGRAGTISIRLQLLGDDVELDIHDDGIGIPLGRAETEAGTRDGIGIQLIRGFARQLGATLTMSETDGTRYTVRMKLQSQRARSLALGPA